MSAETYEWLGGDLHRHDRLTQSHHHHGLHTHDEEAGAGSYVSLAVVAGITAVMLRITCDSWLTVSGRDHGH